ncbi:Imm51 family immunity protein [Mycolicibacterium cosmeticum]|uniref:Imm51 family immunity protein n=1 Tax=Mycolicibacterium cosmeticum TaxID=258533 RepID=UPI003204D776
MDPFDLFEDEDTEYQLILNADDDLPVDDAVDAAGHIPNGHFWTAVARYLIDQNQPALADTIEFDPEAGTFAAYGDRDSLIQLHALMLPAVTDPHTITTLLDAAAAQGNNLFT